MRLPPCQINRTKAGWKQWYTEPLPNIGLFLVRGNQKTVKVFNDAWTGYERYASKKIRHNPGKDQNHVLGAMRVARARFGLRYAYFANNTAILLDKIYTWQHNRTVELGGLAAEQVLFGQKAVAVHTTCYEHTVKVWALKAANAYWNPRYYDPYRRTITKLIYYTKKSEVQEELRALVFLGVVLKRSVILANVIGAMKPKKKVQLKDSYNPKQVWEDEEIPEGIRPVNFVCPGGFMQHYIYDNVGNGAAPIWPGFRLAKQVSDILDFKAYGVELLEAGFYWRCNRHYNTPPPPVIMKIDIKSSLEDIRSIAESEQYKNVPRLVIQMCDGNNCNEEAMMNWASDPTGVGASVQEKTVAAWSILPSLSLPSTLTLNNRGGKKIVTKQSLLSTMREVKDGIRMCKNVFGPLGGNRTCFRKCK